MPKWWHDLGAESNDGPPPSSTVRNRLCAAHMDPDYSQTVSFESGSGVVVSTLIG
jgi:hypothetical protein